MDAELGTTIGGNGDSGGMGRGDGLVARFPLQGFTATGLTGPVDAGRNSEKSSVSRSGMDCMGR